MLSTARGEIETRTLVTEGLRPFQLVGRLVYQIGIRWHFGWAGYATGDIANALTAMVGEPNTSIHENKSLTCNLRKGRLDRHAGDVSAVPPKAWGRHGTSSTRPRR